MRYEKIEISQKGLDYSLRTFEHLFRVKCDGSGDDTLFIVDRDGDGLALPLDKFVEKLKTSPEEWHCLEVQKLLDCAYRSYIVCDPSIPFLGKIENAKFKPMEGDSGLVVKIQESNNNVTLVHEFVHLAKGFLGGESYFDGSAIDRIDYEIKEEIVEIFTASLLMKFSDIIDEIKTKSVEGWIYRLAKFNLARYYGFNVSKTSLLQWRQESEGLISKVESKVKPSIRSRIWFNPTDRDGKGRMLYDYYFWDDLMFALENIGDKDGNTS